MLVSISAAGTVDRLVPQEEEVLSAIDSILGARTDSSVRLHTGSPECPQRTEIVGKFCSELSCIHRVRHEDLSLSENRSLDSCIDNLESRQRFDELRINALPTFQWSARVAPASGHLIGLFDA